MRLGDVLEAAPAIRNLLVLGERVGDQRELAQIVREDNAKRLRGLFARLFFRILQQVERGLDGELLAVDVESAAR